MRCSCGPPAGTSRGAALFAARLLAPLLATYAAVLRAAHALLRSHPAGVSSKALLKAVQGQLLAAAAAGEPGCRGGLASVPSLMLAQSAISSLSAMGVLASPPGAASVGEAAARPAASQSQAVRQQQQQLEQLEQHEQAGLPAAAPTGAPGTPEAKAAGSALDFSPHPSPIKPLLPGRPPLPEGTAAALASRQEPFGSPLAKRRGWQLARGQEYGSGSAAVSSSSRGGSREGSDEEFDPVASSVAVGLCTMAGSSRGNLEALAAEAGGQGSPGGGQAAGDTASQQAIIRAPAGPPAAAVSATQQPTEAAAVGTIDAVKGSEAPAGDTIVLSAAYASEAAFQDLLQQIRLCIVA